MNSSLISSPVIALYFANFVPRLLHTKRSSPEIASGPGQANSRTIALRRIVSAMEAGSLCVLILKMPAWEGTPMLNHIVVSLAAMPPTEPRSRL